MTELKLHDSHGNVCHFQAYEALRAIEALQKFVKECGNMLTPKDIKHGARIYFGSAPRTIVGANDLFYVVDECGELARESSASAREIVSVGYYRKEPR